MLMNTHESRLAALRKELAAQGLAGFVVPISDEHMSEYVGSYAQRLEWLTGFGGSAGTAVVLTDAGRDPAAAIFVDGRYTLQVREQVDARHYAYESVPQTSPAKWLGAHVPEGARIGYDAWLHTKGWVEGVNAALKERGAMLVAVEHNPVDAIWADRPAASAAQALVHDEAHSGQASHAKRAAVSVWLAENKLDAAVITALDSVAWLLNIRGSDVDRTPVALSFVIAHADASADLYIAPEKVSAPLAAHLGDAVRIHPAADFVPALRALSGRRIAVDPERAVHAVFTTLTDGGAKVAELTDPCVLPKAIKNPVEQQGHRNAQARDGAAMARFLHWLSVEGPNGTLDELTAAQRLHQLRGETGDLRDLSFDTISGSGPNGAIVHYRVSEETNRRIEPETVFLVDSGGQYPDGTTDITRTVWIAGPGHAGGEAPAEVRDRFTRVLKGHIAIARAVFPAGTSGSQLDVLARTALWQAGLDYAHGTGHGVGSFLSVHEGPQRISKTGGNQELLPGMIVSNEPGYYKAGEYGIRIENLVLVEPREIAGSEAGFLGFETLTLAPIDRAMIEPSLLDEDERTWLDTYHAAVLEVIGPRLGGEARAWLDGACAPILSGG